MLLIYRTYIVLLSFKELENSATFRRSCNLAFNLSLIRNIDHGYTGLLVNAGLMNFTELLVTIKDI